MLLEDMLRRAPRSAQVADVAAFLASDQAAGVRGTIANWAVGWSPASQGRGLHA